ncbi:uncharacterized protein LOC126717114 [Quercus robur]|uniref:uncharacterized protein LOC126717114 n=1 Tax=Quercus robur TaxID=38942 RepID=UPI002162D25D|nr:uncharacterized protein LOC126717114 [Quercus robur]XP_050274421.1 uncharacterized protein LOC126717114 [Quercus robur]XP_050274422.1 uncharacterized protein LOC126717114 [Quercus robur]XP_050274423.1 uncharacterized protein LOC126717114 [Quercus robur]XP_050274424.1 uncharacterized protein LOC126717114 [Quercus robur]XP_050274425.1 uncharacterized protein LOC126717114 [Quercus robur]XP_050274426.1 uncharacterized protein LOC126717114 [Quercus robur]XP_050274427.1 uncharacterized protein 
MGREIVRSEGNPGQRSRLCNYEEALEVLTEDMGSDKIRGIMLRSPESKPTMVQLEAQIFRKMKNLRFLIIHNVHFLEHGGLEYLPSGLRLLDWDTYPFSSLPSSFCPKKLVVLRMPHNRMEEPLKQIRALEFVTEVDFRCCPFIRKTPDLSMCPNIKDLFLTGCENLVEIEDSVGRFERLFVGEPYGFHFGRWTYQVITWGCTSWCPGQQYPSCQNLSFGNLIGLRELYIGTSENEKPCRLPGSIYNLQHIEKLLLYGEFIFPRDVEIDRQPPCNSLGGFSKYVFPSLKDLTLRFFSNQSEMDFILNYCCPVTLKTLDVFLCKDVTLPESISRCERLLSLKIASGEIPRLPRSLRCLTVSNTWPTPLSLKSVFHWFGELIGVPPNLPPCLGVTSHSTPSSTTISCASAFPFGKKYVNNKFASCFNHQRNGNFISFLIGPEFPTIALCVAFYSTYPLQYYCHAIISVNGSKQTTKSILIEKFLLYEDMSFSCSSLQELFEGFNLGDENLVKIFCETTPPMHDSYLYCREIEWIGVHVQCICPPPQKSSIFHDYYCIQPRGRRISKRNVHQRLRPSLLKGPNFILRRLYNTQYRSTLWPTPSTSLQPLLKARKISNKKRLLVARCRKCLCGAQTFCWSPKEVGSTYSAGWLHILSRTSFSAFEQFGKSDYLKCYEWWRVILGF